MKNQDLHILPKFRDGWSYLYVEHCRIDQEAKAVAIHDAAGKVPVPCANLALLMLGPGVSITHTAVTTLADNGCLVAWCGEEGVRFYAMGMGETRNATNFLHQARMWGGKKPHMRVVRNLYQLRFSQQLDAALTLRQIRGMEGIRVREIYAAAAKETGVKWEGRSYRRDDWNNADPVNRALSTANSCLYGICHAAIVSAGFSPALGFVHTGKMLSFVYDVADLYKTEITIPLAFRAVVEGKEGMERRVRMACRDLFATTRLLERIIPDIQMVLEVPARGAAREGEQFDHDAAAPGTLWDPEEGTVEGGIMYSAGPKEVEPKEAEAEDGGTDS